MMTTDRMDAPLQFTVKKEEDTCKDSDSDASTDELNNLFPLPLPLLSVDKSVMNDRTLSPNNEFIRLNEMVRAVYLSYLHKCLLDNYVSCYEKEENNEDILNIEVKKCADEMELDAVRLALEVTLYRKNMLKMIADIKSHTVRKRKYKKLLIILETSKDKIDVAVQTDDRWVNSQGTDNIQSVCITSNSEEMLQTTPTIVNSSGFDRNENITQGFENEMDVQVSHDEDIVKEIFNDSSQRSEDINNSQIMTDAAAIVNEDENSQDSLLQHLEDMFCESDDSSDLTTLIEKYSGVCKANVDKEISEICSSGNIMNPSASQSNKALNEANKASSIAKKSTSEGKVSYSRYKEMRNKEANILKEPNENDMTNLKYLKQKERINAVWLVERVHQVSKLKTRMIELSMTNYRKHGIIKEKFYQLFGEFDDEEMMPDSPICIEEHLSACKERIAPWIVKYLMPFYKKRRIKNRQLFKVVAKYIADMLIIKDTFPERECVSKYIYDYFKNKKCIKTKQDIYV